MNVASLELCKELYELSGWESDPSYYREIGKEEWKFSPFWFNTLSLKKKSPPFEKVPAYSLGYLLRKLPTNSATAKMSSSYMAMCDPKFGDLLGKNFAMQHEAATPEDATCKLAIELLKQGILKREEV